MEVEEIHNHFYEDNNWFGTFECPNCYQKWGPSNHGQAPKSEVVDVTCTCGADLRIRGQWVKVYEMEVEELVND